ncbi:MAG: hypothetical protein ACYDIE_01285 [Candidatus Krumholzibacteriia bacterium]
MRTLGSAVMFALLVLILASAVTAADLALTPAAPDPINCSRTVTVDFVYRPEPDAPDLRGYNIHVRTWGAVLTFDFADLIDGSPFAPNAAYFDAVSDGAGGWIVSGAQLGGLTGLAREATLFSATFHVRADSLILDGTGHVIVASAEFRDLVNAEIAVGTLGESVVPVDCFPPWWVSGVHAEPRNGGAVVGWNASTSTDVAGYEIWRALWYDTTPGVSAYPEYDDLPGNIIPARPGTRADAAASGVWTLAGAVDGATLTFTDTVAPRGIWYYEVYAVDTADNYSYQAGANGRATNYWLGDVEPYTDGRVETADIGILGASFGETDGSPLYDAVADVGPTEDNSCLGVPRTDSRIDFEDLMIFAMNFGFAYPKAPVATTPPAAPALAFVRLDDTIWSLRLDAPCAGLKGLRLAAALPAGVTAVVTRGELLDRQAAPVFLRNIAARGLDASLAVLGVGAGIVGDGELLRVVLPADAAPTGLTIAARGLDNEPLTATSGNAAVVPDALRLDAIVPNPFNPAARIVFSLPATQRVRVSVYALDGRLIADLRDEVLPAGRHESLWNGRDNAGRAVATGTYLARLEAGGSVLTRKMSLLK